MKGAELVAAIVSDVLSVAGIPGSSTLQEAVKRLVAKRLNDARVIFLEELRRGDKELSHVGEEDEVAAILFRYQRAAVEGAARLNLRLLAAVAAGQSVQGGFKADEFLAWSDDLAGLRREEIIVLAAMYEAENAPPADLGPNKTLAMWQHQGKWERVCGAVIPDPFAAREEVLAAAASASRSGLAMISGGGYDLAVTTVTTTKLRRLLELAPIEPLLGREGIRLRTSREG